MNAPLVDAEGFPRADIDVHAVRHAKNQLLRYIVLLSFQVFGLPQFDFSI